MLKGISRSLVTSTRLLTTKVTTQPLKPTQFPRATKEYQAVVVPPGFQSTTTADRLNKAIEPLVLEGWSIEHVVTTDVGGSIIIFAQRPTK